MRSPTSGSLAAVSIARLMYSVLRSSATCVRPVGAVATGIAVAFLGCGSATLLQHRPHSGHTAGSTPGEGAEVLVGHLRPLLGRDVPDGLHAGIGARSTVAGLSNHGGSVCALVERWETFRQLV